MPSKDGWVHDRDHEKITLGKKQYRNMEEWSRPCGICAEKFSIFVRTNNNGTVNSSFGLRTCKQHRGEKITGGIVAADMPAMETLKMANKCMTEELDGLYAENKDLKTRLARYELQPAMEAAQNKMPWD